MIQHLYQPMVSEELMLFQKLIDHFRQTFALRDAKTSQNPVWSNWQTSESSVIEPQQNDAIVRVL